MSDMRATPETDAFAHAKYVSSMYAAASGSALGIVGTEQSPEEAYGEAIEFARKLERQRDALAEALRKCEWKLRTMAREFNHTNFTDRYGDGPVMLKLADEAKAALSSL